MDTVGQGVDHITGKEIEAMPDCDFLGVSPDYYAVSLPGSLKVYVGKEPDGLTKVESTSRNCLRGLNGNVLLKDFGKSGEYKIMYNNNLIGIELQRALGWVDIDGDNIAELIDQSPYGGYTEQPNKGIGEPIGKFYFEPTGEVQISQCTFEKARLENGMTGFIPLECPEFGRYVVNIYQKVAYNWLVVHKDFGDVLLASTYRIPPMLPLK